MSDLRNRLASLANLLYEQPAATSLGLHTVPDEAAARIRELEAEVAHGIGFLDHKAGTMDCKNTYDAINRLEQIIEAAQTTDPAQIVALVEAGRKPRLKLRPFSDWHEDDYDAIWLYFEFDDETPIAYIGSPLDEDWADEPAHWDMARVGWVPFNAIDYSAQIAASARDGEGGEG